MLTNNMPSKAVILAYTTSNIPLDEATLDAVSRQANKAAAPYMFLQFVLFGMLGGASAVAIGLLQGRKKKGQPLAGENASRPTP